MIGAARARIGRVVVSAGAPGVAASFWAPPADLSALLGRGLDIAEARLDLLGAPANGAAAAELLASLKGAPALLTLRPHWEGGGWRGEESARKALLLSALSRCDAVDIELSATAILPDIVAAARAAGKTVIVSRHDFVGGFDSESLDAVAASAAAAGADIFKFAGVCASAAALRELKAFAGRGAAAADIPRAVIGMDNGAGSDWARRARLELPAAGSCLAFAAVGEAASAPGQLPLEETVAAANRGRAAASEPRLMGD